MAVTTNFDDLKRMHSEARRKGPMTRPWIDFATTMMDSFLSLYDTAKKMNENAAKLRGFHPGDELEEHF